MKQQAGFDQKWSCSMVMVLVEKGVGFLLQKFK